MSNARPAVALRSLTLTVTERCNLRCSYCCVPVARGRDLSPELADRAVDLLALHAAGSSVTLGYYGGEPLLAIDTVRRSLRRARRALGGKRRLRVLMPTNGLLLTDPLLEICRRERIELAISFDGGQSGCLRVHPDGRPSTPELIERLPALLADAPRSLARMTVTPANVERLAANVKAVARLGFRRIHFQPAFEQAWSGEAVAAWAREQRRIGCWLGGAAAAGARTPELPAWDAIAARLTRARGKGWCGAGRRIVAVGPDGSLHACYRLVFGGDPAWRMGDLERGFDRQAVERLARFDPMRLSPEQGDCESCQARDGCTHACPALGIERAGDPAHVPALACRLMRAQVRAVRLQLAAARRRAPPRRGGRRAQLAAAALAAAALGASAAGCASSVEVVSERDAGSGGGSSSAAGGTGGLFTVGGSGSIGGAIELDAGTGGLCDVPPPDGGGGICPDPQEGGGAWGPGLC